MQAVQSIGNATAERLQSMFGAVAAQMVTDAATSLGIRMSTTPIDPDHSELTCVFGVWVHTGYMVDPSIFDPEIERLLLAHQHTVKDNVASLQKKRPNVAMSCNDGFHVTIFITDKRVRVEYCIHCSG